ncbi:MAG: hypothetical protein RL040_659, partial [Bacteroidota bacterium]
MKYRLTIAFCLILSASLVTAQDNQGVSVERLVEKLNDNSYRVVVNIADSNTIGISKVLEVFPAGSSFQIIQSDSAVVSAGEQSAKFVWLNRKKKSLRLEYRLETNGATWESILGQYYYKDDQTEYSYFINGKLIKEIKEQEPATVISGASIKISGIVKEQSTGEPLIGAVIAAGSVGTTTDLDGQFELQIDKDQTITISFIGMESIELNSSDFKGSDKLLIELNPN